MAVPCPQKQSPPPATFWTATYTPAALASPAHQSTGNGYSITSGGYTYSNNLWSPSGTKTRQRLQVAGNGTHEWACQFYGGKTTTESVFGYPNIQVSFKKTTGHLTPLATMTRLNVTFTHHMPATATTYHVEAAFTMSFYRKTMTRTEFTNAANIVNTTPVPATWSSSTTYHLNDGAKNSSGHLYISLRTTNTNHPLTTKTWWGTKGWTLNNAQHRYVMIWTQIHCTVGAGTLRFTFTTNGLFTGHLGELSNGPGGNLILLPVTKTGTTNVRRTLNGITLDILSILRHLATIGGTKWLNAGSTLQWIQYGFETRNSFTQKLNLRVTKYNLTSA